MLDARLAKAVERLDVTYHVIRHITTRRRRKLTNEIRSYSGSTKLCDRSDSCAEVFALFSLGGGQLGGIALRRAGA